MDIPSEAMEDMAAETRRLQAAAQRGIECPQCGCRDMRVETTRRSDNMVVRYRVCRHCGQRKSTIES